MANRLQNKYGAFSTPEANSIFDKMNKVMQEILAEAEAKQFTDDEYLALEIMVMLEVSTSFSERRLREGLNRSRIERSLKKILEPSGEVPSVEQLRRDDYNYLRGGESDGQDANKG